MSGTNRIKYRIAGFLLLLATACSGTQNRYLDRQMDFGSVRVVAVMPFTNLSRDNLAGERVRDVFVNMLLASEAIYVIPLGEVVRTMGRVGVASPSTPSTEEVIKLGKALKADALFTGVVKEYGEVRSGTATANIASISLQMVETASGKVVWSASTTKGGVGFSDRLLGGGGAPVNDVTEDAVNDLLNKLFR